jgi:hypothetical protein
MHHSFCHAEEELAGLLSSIQFCLRCLLPHAEWSRRGRACSRERTASRYGECLRGATVQGWGSFTFGTGSGTCLLMEQYTMACSWWVTWLGTAVKGDEKTGDKWEREFIRSEVSHGRHYEWCRLVGCDAVWIFWELTLPKNVMPPSSSWQDPERQE